MSKKKQYWPDRVSYYAEIVDKFKIKRADMALFLFFILASLFSAANMYLIIGFSDGPGSIVVTNKGDRTVLSLDQDRIIDLGQDEEACVLKISKGKAEIVRSNCPKKICVNTGAIGKPGQSIICLSHKVVIEIQGENDLDASIR